MLNKILKPIFIIRQTEILGNFHIPSDKIIADSGLKLGTNMLRYTNFFLNYKLCKNPYIENIKLKKCFPGIIKIKVKERSEFSVLCFDSEYFLISRDFYVLDKITSGAKNSNLIEIYGIEVLKIRDKYKLNSTNEKYKIFTLTIDQLSKFDTLEKMKTIDFSDLKNVKFNYNNKIFAYISLEDECEYKIKFMSYLLKKYLANQKGILEYINEDFHFVSD